MDEQQLIQDLEVLKEAYAGQAVQDLLDPK